MVLDDGTEWPFSAEFQNELLLRNMRETKEGD